jgi:hypothetical protein
VERDAAAWRRAAVIAGSVSARVEVEQVRVEEELLARCYS